MLYHVLVPLSVLMVVVLSAGSLVLPDGLLVLRYLFCVGGST